MHHVQLDLSHDNFYCPATGFHMLSAEHYEASPATLFVYPEDADEFEWYSRELEKLEATINTDEIVAECEDGLSNVERFLASIKDKLNPCCVHNHHFGNRLWAGFKHRRYLHRYGLL